MSTDRIDVLHLRAAGVSVVLDRTGDRLPRVLHWGADLGDVPAVELGALLAVSVPPLSPGSTDAPVPVSLLPEQSLGWLGTPGVTGHRDGADFSVAFTVTGVEHEVVTDGVGAHRVVVTAHDDVAALGLRVELELLASGLLRSRATLTNTGAGVYTLGTLDLALPVPPEADEILDFTGRHLRERSPQRAPFDVGTRLRESRRARAHDATLLMLAGRSGFGYRSGEVWGVHVAWSGNTRTLAERTSSGVRLLGAGELLLAGEVRLESGDEYAGPWVYASYGDGLDELAGRFHGYLRARPHHPSGPRPVLLNVWEAVYFNHDLDRLRVLADRAAAIGVERYVLDDGWFRGRRDDTAGLGDWYVDETVWPDGLGPLVDHVRGLGMQFGLWFEPEMVNPDSDVARAHPDWLLGTGGRLAPPARHQQVLDLAHPDAYAFVLERIDAILTEHPIDYVKWDHNRDLIDAGRGPTGRAGVHEQTLATYRLMDELRARHPGLEIESCAGGVGDPTSGSWSGPSGSGRRTPSTPSSGRPSRRVTACCCHRRWSARTSALPLRTPPGGPTSSASAPGPPSSPTSASSGTSRPPTTPTWRRWARGSRRTRGTARCCTAEPSSMRTRRTRRCGCAAWSLPTVARRSSRSSRSAPR